MTEEECSAKGHRIDVHGSGRCACGTWAILPARFTYCRCGRLIRPQDGDVTTHPECEDVTATPPTFTSTTSTQENE